MNADKSKIYNTDCIEFMATMPDKSVDMILTDPPYLYLKHKLDKQFPEQKFFEECFRVLKDNSILAFFGRGKSFYRWNYLCEQIGFEFKEEIIWYKKYTSSPMLTVQRVHETISILQKGNRNLNKVYVDKIEHDREMNPQTIENDLKRMLGEFKKIQTIEDLTEFHKGEYTGKPKKAGVTRKTKIVSPSSTFSCFQSHTKGRQLTSIIPEVRNHLTAEHPTQKPVPLLEKLILLCSQEGQTILDPFMGGGSTGVACASTNRHFIGCEILPEYFTVAERRIQKEKDKTGLFNCEYENG